MALSSKLFPAVLLLLLLVTDMGPVQEVMAGAPCQRSLCKKCTGSCFDPDECSILCRNEGYQTGDCTTQDQAYRCMCSNNC
nr:defensin Tm-AMP-D1.2-like [Lolium perenne]